MRAILREWCRVTDVLEPMTRRRRNVVIAFSVAVAATRLLALSHSIWDWDEALFCSALRHYDVAAHHPHPPGFPLFFLLANLARLVVRDDFHALRAVSVAASMFVFPAAFALARSIRLRFHSCIIAALLVAFLPNVWYFGGTAFSDELAFVTSIATVAYLLRDDGRRWTYLRGSILFAATMLVRPQNLLLAWPWLLATWRRLRARRIGDAVPSALLIAALVAIGYGLAAAKTGWQEYIDAVRWHQHYVATVDGAFNPTRPPLAKLLLEFSVDPFLARTVSWVLFGLGVVAFARRERWRIHADLLLTFLPNFFLAWLLLSPTGVSRLSLAYISLNAMLAADGIEAISDAAASRVRRWPRERVAVMIAACLATIIIGRYVYWLYPGLRDARKNDSPPMQAMRWVTHHVPRGSRIYYSPAYAPIAIYALEGYDIVEAGADFDPLKAPAAQAYFVDDHLSNAALAVNFVRRQKPLWAVSHRRGFEASVVPVSGWVKYGAGWYDPEENADGAQWRWMGTESRTLLQSLHRRASLDLVMTFPLDAEPAPVVTLVLDGNVLDRFVPPSREVTRSYVFDSATPVQHELVIHVSHAVNPAKVHPGGDARDLGLQLLKLAWRAAVGSRE